MSLREKVRRAIRRVSPAFSPKDDGKPKIEYYRRSEVPRSKYRGPVDPEHQKRLRAWTFEGAMVDRRRSVELSLSPCASIEGVAPCDEDTPETPSPDVNEGVVVDETEDSLAVCHDEGACDRQTNIGSQASTAVNSSSGTSILTLPADAQSPLAVRRDSIAQIKSLPYMSPVSQAQSPIGKHMPFLPEHLAQALSATQIHA